MPHTVIVVPCFNEEHRLPVHLLRDFIARNPWVHFVMVDDGSRDGTATLLTRLHAEHPESVDVVCLSQNMGKAEAVRLGLCAAIERHPEFVGYWDADLAAPLQLLSQFRETMERHPDVEIVLGSRIPLAGRVIQRQPLRRLGGRAFAWCASVVLGLQIYDTQAGHKLFRVNSRLKQAVSTPFQTHWIFDVELLLRWLDQPQRLSLQQAQAAIFELPLDEWHDVAGSKVSSLDFVRAVGDLACIALSRIRTYLRQLIYGPGSITPAYHRRVPFTTR